jgi:PREDICTED: similar to CG12325-PA
MKFFYKFNNVLGSVYHKGNLTFTPDGYTLLSPVGNRIVFHDLTNSQSKSLPIEADFNFAHMSVSPNGRLLLSSTENNRIYIISLSTGSILYHKDFKHISNSINCLSFSPNGFYYVICADNYAFVYLTPGLGKYIIFILISFVLIDIFTQNSADQSGP